ncbi:hypothetical protein [Proteus sp. fly-1067]|uniref:hypothetical protein n=1 Tax=Proteus sp. fly-1067 TaxID=3136674 RepID=UPI0032DAE634
MEKCDYFNYAKNIIENNNSEVAIRTSISRSYYSCYYHAGELLKIGYKQSQEWSLMPFGEHKKLIDSLIKFNGCKESYPKKLVAKIGNNLNILKIKRHDADYNLGLTYTKQKALQVINDSERLINLVNTCIADRENSVSGIEK